MRALHLTKHHVAPPGTAALWAGWLVAMLAWGLHLFVSYGFVEWYCRHRSMVETGTAKVLLHGATLVCFSAALVGAGIAWRNRRTLPRDQSAEWVRRGRFMANFGLGLSGFLAVVILVQGLPNLLLKPCF